jgi:hypothetical protein
MESETYTKVSTSQATVLKEFNSGNWDIIKPQVPHVDLKVYRYQVFGE